MLTLASKRICIWAVPRSGSSFLYTGLKKHLRNNYNNFNTLFNNLHRGSEPFRTTKEDYTAMLQAFKREPNWLAKLHSIDLRHLQAHSIDKVFYDMCDYNIVLIRKDLFEATLSLCIAKQKKQFINNQDSIPITIRESFFEREYGGTIDNTNRIIDYVKADTVLYTEELPSNPNSIWGMLTGTEPIKLIDNPIEMSPDKQSVVTNYDELKELYNALRTSR